MRFEGRVWFDPDVEAVWRFYRLLTLAVRQGAELALEWAPFLLHPGSLAVLASYLAVRERDLPRHGAYLQALLALRHLEGADLVDPATWRAAARAAETSEDAVVPDDGHRLAVQASTDEARRLGVASVPTLYRHGPVLEVLVTPAAYEGDALARLATIDAVLGDDALWRLAKP